jgi:hypothetical protein
MLWGSFALALAIGAIVSAGLYVAYLWPEVEMHVEEDEQERSPATDGQAADRS